MESVMNFLAENYIWFFVAAGVLLFALIGFAIDSKRKNKSEFKGETIEEKKEVPTETIDLTNELKGEEVKEDKVEDLDLNNSEEVKLEEVSEPESIETPSFEEVPVNPELESLDSNTISFGTIPEIKKEDFEEAKVEPLEKVDFSSNLDEK